jgi:hypothetical protein
MAKRKMFKELTNAHLEGLGSDGNWNLFATVDKQQTQLVSAYLEKVRISYLLYDIPAGDTAPSDAGIMFCASIEDTLDSSVASNNNGKIIAAAAGRLIGGTVVLDIKRTIKSNAEEVGRADGPIYLFVRNTDGLSTSNALVTLESHGRYCKVATA